jgi:hypothetical protein
MHVLAPGASSFLVMPLPTRLQSNQLHASLLGRGPGGLLRGWQQAVFGNLARGEKPRTNWAPTSQRRPQCQEKVKHTTNYCRKKKGVRESEGDNVTGLRSSRLTRFISEYKSAVICKVCFLYGGSLICLRCRVINAQSFSFFFFFSPLRTGSCSAATLSARSTQTPQLKHLLLLRLVVATALRRLRLLLKLPIHSQRHHQQQLKRLHLLLLLLLPP